MNSLNSYKEIASHILIVKSFFFNIKHSEFIGILDTTNIYNIHNFQNILKQNRNTTNLFDLLSLLIYFTTRRYSFQSTQATKIQIYIEILIY